MKRLLATCAMVVALCAALPAAASATAPEAASAPPRDFLGVPLGATLAQVRERYPQIKRNPDSDQDFDVYMVPELPGIEVKSSAAFNFYRGRMVGGQVLLATATAAYWLKAMIARYGAPESCAYCDYPDMASAHWHWDNGTRLLIDGGGMLSLFTSEGREQRQAWIARGDKASVASLARGPELSDLPLAAIRSHPVKAAARPMPTAAPALPPPPRTRWQKLYALARRRLGEWWRGR